jgi:hypothetical protein
MRKITLLCICGVLWASVLACRPLARQVVGFLQTATFTPSVTPSATPTFTPSQTPTFTPSHTPTATATPTATLTPSVTPSPTEAGTPTPTPVWQKADPSQLRLPPADFTNNPHLWFIPAIAAGNSSPASAYRFGMTFTFGALRPHHGIDLANPAGTPVIAMGAGTVLYAGSDLETLWGPYNDFYGNLVVVQAQQTWLGQPVYYLFGHLQDVLVTSGQVVAQGETVATVGSTGIAPAPHLHVEVRVGGNPNDYNAVRNPELWINPGGYAILAGRVLDARGRFVPGNTVLLQCQDAVTRAVDTYWEYSTPPDDELVENFVVGGIPAGYCDLSTEINGELIVEKDVFVKGGTVSTVILQAKP